MVNRRDASCSLPRREEEVAPDDESPARRRVRLRTPIKVTVAGCKDMNLYPERSGSSRNGARLVFSGNGIGRVDQQGERGRRRKQLVQQLEFLRSQLHVQPVTPVTLPPGRFRLATRPRRIGSVDWNTIGMVVVAAFAASVAGVPPVTMTFTPRRTRSTAIDGSRSFCRPPSGIRLSRSGPRHSRFRSGLGDAAHAPRERRRANCR